MRCSTSHTIYQILSSSNSKSYNVSSSSHRVNNRQSKQITLEEVYDIELAKKTFSLHLDSTTSSSRGVMSSHLSNSLRTSEMHQSIIREERDENCCFTFDIQEINNGVLNGSGTGSMSWDSSIGKLLMMHSFCFLYVLNVIFCFYLILYLSSPCLHLGIMSKK